MCDRTFINILVQACAWAQRLLTANVG